MVQEEFDFAASMTDEGSGEEEQTEAPPLPQETTISAGTGSSNLGGFTGVLQNVVSARKDLSIKPMEYGYGTIGLHSKSVRLDVEYAADAAAGDLTWRKTMEQALYAALASDNVGTLRERLIRVAALTMAWVETIDASS